MTNSEKAAQELRDRRKELVKDLTEIEHSLDAPPSKDWEDRSSERQGDEVLEALGTHDLDEVRQIDAALSRIEDGSFGICARCGENISEERLSAIPETPICINCAQKSGH